MFGGFKAWFSKSVDTTYLELWDSCAGIIVDNVVEADYLFSADADAEDTKVLYTSDDYQNDRLVVIHPMYIDYSLHPESSKSRHNMGQFALPPSADQNEARSSMNRCFPWDTLDCNRMLHSQHHNDEQSSENDSLYAFKENLSEDDGTSCQFGIDLNDCEDLSKLPKVTGPIYEFIPGSDGCEIILIDS